MASKSTSSTPEVEYVERARFRVKSDSGNSPYLVDMLEHNRNGRCDCVDFRINVESEYKYGQIPKRRTCRHIRKVIRFVADKVFEQIEQQYEKLKNEQPE